MDRAGVGQAELGRRIGLTRVQVNRLLSGKRLWSPEVIDRISLALRIPMPGEAEAHPAGRPQYAKVVGVVNPKIWIEGQYEPDPDVRIPFAPGARFAKMEQSAYLLGIDVPAKGLSSGAYMLTVALPLAQRFVREGSLIICARSNQDLHNCTIGQARMDDGGGYVVVSQLGKVITDAPAIALVIGAFHSLA